MCTGGAYIVARVCVCRCDSCVCKGVQGSVRVYVQGGADIAARIVKLLQIRILLFLPCYFSLPCSLFQVSILLPFLPLN